MSAPVAPVAISRWIPDHVAVVGMLMATTAAVLLVTVLFSVLRRFSKQERSEAPASVMAPTPPIASISSITALPVRD